MKKLTKDRRCKLEEVACKPLSDEQLLCINHFNGQVGIKLIVDNCTTGEFARTKNQNDSFVAGFAYRFINPSDDDKDDRPSWWQQGWKYADSLIKTIPEVK